MHVRVTQHCVTVAIRWQESRRAIGARFVAAFTGLWLLTCGFLVARHEAEVLHVRDRAGRVVHGALGDSRDGDGEQRIHARDSASHDHHVCLLAASLHQRAAIEPAAIASPVAIVGLVVDDPAGQAGRPQRHVYRLAPKTSPPRT
jgi:hypothetical protein